VLAAGPAAATFVPLLANTGAVWGGLPPRDLDQLGVALAGDASS